MAAPTMFNLASSGGVAVSACSCDGNGNCNTGTSCPVPLIDRPVCICSTPPGDDSCPECGPYNVSDWSTTVTFIGGTAFTDPPYPPDSYDWSSTALCITVHPGTIGTVNVVTPPSIAEIEITYTGALDPKPKCVAAQIFSLIQMTVTGLDGPPPALCLGADDGFGDPVFVTGGAGETDLGSKGTKCIVLPVDPNGIARLVLGYFLDGLVMPDSGSSGGTLCDQHQVTVTIETSCP